MESSNTLRAVSLRLSPLAIPAIILTAAFAGAPTPAWAQLQNDPSGNPSIPDAPAAINQDAEAAQVEEQPAGLDLGPYTLDISLNNAYAAMDLSQLMSIQVESVTGVAEDWFKTPAAIYVIDSSDIANSGLQSLAELLRLSPGMHVGRINAGEWAVSSRGFSNQYANKLQVLIDGREIYEPLFSGVRWRFHDMILDDIDRIEVIRGPGATLWGANAVNGVVNVETKSAKDTQGLYIKQIVGTELRNVTAVRYGAQSGEDTSYRVWGKYTNRDSSAHGGNGGGFDDWDMTYGGFRLDHDGPDNITSTIHGSAYASGRIGEQTTAPGTAPFTSQLLRGDSRAHGGNLVGRVRHDDDTQGWQATAYVDFMEDHSHTGYDQQLFTFNLDWRHHFELNERHALIYGLQYRHNTYDTGSDIRAAFDPASDELNLFTGFIQDTITLVPDRLFMMVGSKFEHNDYTGFEVQPNVRLWWTPSERHTLWTSVSRAIRRPSPLDRTVVNTILPGMGDDIQLLGNPDYKSEDMLAVELGYRVRPSDQLILDTTIFWNSYDDVFSLTNVGNDLVFDNNATAQGYGFEASATWMPNANFELTGSYSLLLLSIEDANTATYENASPKHQFQVRSNYKITDDMTFNTALYYVSPIESVDAYYRLDLGLTWRVNDRLDISVWGQNLLDDSHEEFVGTLTSDTGIDRGAYVQLRYRF